jgi:hypothetical protein
VCGGSRHVSEKRSGGRGFMPGFCVFGAGAWAAATTAETTSHIGIRVARTAFS